MYLARRFGQQHFAQGIIAIALVGSLITGTVTFIARTPSALQVSTTGEHVRTLPNVTAVDVVPGPYELYHAAGAPPRTLRNDVVDTAPAESEHVLGPYELYHAAGTTPMERTTMIDRSPAETGAAHAPNGPWQRYHCGGCP